MSVEGRRPRHKPDGDSHNGSAADSDSARGSSILSSPTTPQQLGCCGFSLRGVAQLVARLVRDQEARGSNPRTPTIKETSFVYQDKRGFFLLSGQNKGRIIEKRGLERSIGYSEARFLLSAAETVRKRRCTNRISLLCKQLLNVFRV